MKRHFAIVALAAIVIAGCNAEHKSENADYANVDALTADTVADTELAQKMTKTADMRFRVKDVQRTKEDLSNSIRKQGGLVMEFTINSAIRKSEKIKLSADSLKEITAYRTDGYLVARIPADKLDDFTNQIAGMAVFVDNQSLKMEDKSLAYLSNKLKSANRKQAVAQLNKVSAKKGSNVERSLYLKDDFADKKIENILIDDQVRYSTITLSFYQDNTIKTMVVANDNSYDYKPNFFRRLGLNLVDGWTYFKEFILFLSKFWLFFAAGAAIYFGVNHYLKLQKAKHLLPPSSK